MKKLLLAASALALGVPTASNAAVDVTLNYDASSVFTVPANNNFVSFLNGLGFTQYVQGALTSLVMNQAASIQFYFLGTESGFSDTFTTSNISFTENTSFQDNTAAPIYLGGTLFNAGSLAGLISFSNSGNATVSTVGTPGFGIYLPQGFQSGGTLTEFYIGYDDEVLNIDDNHDDMIIKAVVTAVPEPTTWAMFVAGFGLIGWSIRRRKAQGEGALATA
jgi:hypothetical protein